jgi:uncharacterized protein YbjT (DUF2867 family)
METRIAAVVGATGLVGGHLLDALLADRRHSRVVALVRRASARAHPALAQRNVDLGRLDDVDESPADLYCCLGTTIAKAGSREAFRQIDYHYPLNFARWGLSRGARRYMLVSSIGAGAGSNFYLGVKGELESALEELGFESLHIFQPSFLMGERAEKRVGERIGIAVARTLAPAMVGPLRQYRPVEAARVARSMVAAAWSGAACGVVRHRYAQFV